MPKNNTTQEQVEKARAEHKAAESKKAAEASAKKSEIRSRASSGEEVSVDELAYGLGETIVAQRFPGRPVTASARHRAASTLHGWADHAHHAGKPMKLTREDYLAALDAAQKTDKHGKAQPHAPAVSEYSPHRKG